MSSESEAILHAQAIGRLREVVPMLQAAVKEASGKGAPIIAVGYQNPDKSGSHAMTLEDPSSLLNDLAVVLGLPLEIDRKTELRYKARKFLGQHNL